MLLIEWIAVTHAHAVQLDHQGKKFAEVVKNFVGPVSTRLYLTILRRGYEKEVAVVRHNRLTTSQSHDALAALHARLSYMTVRLPNQIDSADSSRLNAPREGGAETRDQEEVRAGSVAVGLDLRRSGTGEWVVSRVDGEGPAREALVEEGDVILQVDATALKSLGVFDVLHLLDGPSTAASAALRVHRPVSHSGPREEPRQLLVPRRPFPERSTLVSFDVPLPPPEDPDELDTGGKAQSDATSAEAGAWQGVKSFAASVASPSTTLYQDSKRLAQDIEGKINDMSFSLEAAPIKMPVPTLWELPKLPSPPAISLPAWDLPTPPALSLPQWEWHRGSSSAAATQTQNGGPEADASAVKGRGSGHEGGVEDGQGTVVREVAAERATAKEQIREREEERERSEALERDRIEQDIQKEQRRRESEEAKRADKEQRMREMEEEEDRVFKGDGFE